MEVNGRKTSAQRAETLKAFRRAPPNVVLVISSVGTTGLNLDFANIMIIAVSYFIFVSFLPS